MKRKTLDIAFSFGGVVFSVLLLVVGLILTDQKNFADDYVSGQLEEQAITFKAADKLASEEDFQATLLEKFGGDSLREMKRNLDGYLAQVGARLGS